MKETSFIDQNKEKWNRFEKLSQSETRDPDELSSLYMDITDDLSYAQTFYQRRTVRVYLNQLAQRIYTDLHIQRGESIKKLISVWKVSLPLEIYRSRKTLLFALVVFLLWATIGAVSTHFDPGFARVIVGDAYVEMTNRNIANGNPLAVYETDSHLGMFIRITTNNLRVAFLTFIFGIFFTIGTHIFLFKNGVMLGAFQYYFATKGLLLTSFLGIWIHGAFEISAIVLAGGAGITMGNAWLFPGNYTRLQSLQLGAKRGLKIMLSLVPFIITAGFLESFVTANYQSLAEWSKWTLILLSFGIIIGYYVVYPMIVARKYPHLLEQEEVVNTFPNKYFNLQRIRTLGQIISDSFRFYRIHFSSFFRINMFVIFPLAVGLIYFQDQLHAEMMETNYWFDWAKQLEIMIGFGFESDQDYLINGLWSVLFSLMIISVSYVFKNGQQVIRWKEFFLFAAKKLPLVWVGSLLLFFTISLIPWQWYFVLIFVIPFFYLNGVTASAVEEKAGRRFSLGWKYSAQSYGNSLMVLFLFFVILALFAQPIAFVGSIHDNNFVSSPPMPDLLDLLTDFVKNVCDTFHWNKWVISNYVRQLVYLIFIMAVFPLWIIAMHFLVYNEHEKETANGLKADFQKFGKRSKVKEHDVDYEED
ncbi:MAG: stage II sporulation protein M [Bacteroidetes bacterium]|nr:MAG: stage II sporulation protein M [Bacteroidota bacterium]